MEIAFIVFWCLLFVVIGVLILVGKGDRFIKCLNRPGAEKYNVSRVRIVNALLMFVGAITFATFFFIKNNISVIRIVGGVEILIVIILQVLNMTWTKKW